MMVDLKRELSSKKGCIGPALGRIPSGCSILTVSHQGKSTGMLVSWVQQAAFEPLSLTVCLRPERPAVALITGSGKFLLNVIGSDPGPMFKHFGKGFGPNDDAFVGVAVQESAYGPLIEDCIAHLACEVRSKVSAGDHDLYLAEIHSAWSAVSAESYTHTRTTGLGY